MDQDPTATYHHTQSSPQWVVALVSLLAIVAFSGAVAVVRSEDGSAWFALFILVWAAVIYLTVLNFTRLTTTVNPSTIHLVWRLGWPQKTIDRATVTSAQRHRNTWLAGWGLRYVRRGWMWNVWGLESVQLELDTGRVFRIGSDEPDALLAALSR